MFNIGDRVRVYKTNWGPKKCYVGYEYIISEIRCGKDAATTYILSRPADGDSPTGACSHVWYDSELALVCSINNLKKIAINSVYGTSGPAWDGFRAGFTMADEFIKYSENDVKTTMEMYKFMNGNYIQRVLPKIKNVIFNDPATIVFWSDGSKTVVKCQDDDWYDPEKGLAMAISKKALGNKGNYCNEIKKWLPEEEPIDWCDDIFKWGNEVAKGIMDGLCKPITIPELSMVNGVTNSIKRKELIRKAYAILVRINQDSNNNHRDYQVPMDDIDTAIGYLGQALEG